MPILPVCSARQVRAVEFPTVPVTAADAMKHRQGAINSNRRNNFRRHVALPEDATLPNLS